MALFHFSAKIFSRRSRNTVRAVAYRAGCQLADSQTGENFDYRHKEVEHVELLLPKDTPNWALEIQELMKGDRQKAVQKLVDVVEAPEKRINSQVWREFEFALHRELTNEQNIALAREFIKDQICTRGMAAQLNFHFDTDEKTGEAKPHCHVLVPTRSLTEDGMGPKERDWNRKELLRDLRVQWQDYSNFHLKLHGHNVSIDHRCNKDRGIEMEPQPKRSKNIVEIEKKQKSKSDKASKDDLSTQPITEKQKAFQAVQLRNLYRIVRNPEVVLDIVTKHHTTFMWADIQKVLHRYVDDLPLFQRLETHLQNSKELLLLKPEEKESGKAIYTTHSMLKAEKSLIESAETFSDSGSHGVEEREIVQGLIKTNEELNTYGGLSQDQIKAIYHLTDKGQVKCVVGTAGAGKTTALKTCQDIWQASGYAVYGLAPTGKAAQNLEKEGIKSSTLHKFLKDFDEGWCQYNPNSILVLDEAGMVDVERFSQLMGAVKHLGVKLIVVGDGAQLQPVEAGPAFRLVTERIGKSELHTVIRQKEDWQKEATVLFGRQETQEAIQTYMGRGHVHIVEEKLPSLKEILETNDKEGVIKLYEISKRTSSLMYREMANDTNGSFVRIKQHQDFEHYLYWKDQEKQTASHILKNGNEYKEILQERGLDPLKMALLFVSKTQDKVTQQEAAKQLVQKSDLESLIGIERPLGQSVDIRSQTKEVLVQSWLTQFKETPEQSLLMLAFSNRDMGDLNRSARSFLKESGHIDQKDFTYTIKRENDDDFGRKQITVEEKAFSIGDRIVFTRNNRSLGVQNGSMGIITSLDKQTIQVKMDGEDGKEISFAPNLNPYFDQGWAITIHKSQGTTVDQTFVLASYEMTQNLAYVSMTRHRENVRVFGSNLDFWRPEKLPEVLSKSGEKLSAADYLDADSLNKLMQADDKLITKIFTRMSHELEAMGAVSQKIFWQVADHFLGIKRENEIRVAPDFSNSIREEVRADEVLQKTTKSRLVKDNALSQEKTLDSSTKSGFQKSFRMGRTDTHPLSQGLDAQVIEDALRQNIASFADDIFSSIGEPYNAGASSSSQRRYGKKGHISVNLKTGAWIDYKDDSLSGGPLHLLTKVKGLSFKKALEYGANWAGISQKGLTQTSSLHKGMQIMDEKSPAKADGLDEDDKLKIEKAQALWNKGQPIQGTVAERYLREHRKIEGELPDALRYLPFFKDKQSQQSFPCLMSGVRSPSREITAVQLTFLNPKTAAKADLEVTKKSFGVIKGSAVTLQTNEDSETLFIAEGVETALSLKLSRIEETIKASLGLSNMKQIVPDIPGTPIVICADHDAPHSSAAKSLERAVNVLQEKGCVVTVIKPDQLGDDFNDVLKKQGPQGVREIMERGLGYDKFSDKGDSNEKRNNNNSYGDHNHGEHNFNNYPQDVASHPSNNFATLIQRCEQRLYNLLERENLPLTIERKDRIPLQAERTASYILHTHGDTCTLPREYETVNFSLRAKFELDRLPEIHRDLMDQGETSTCRAYSIADRLTSIEGRLYFEALQKDAEPPFNMAFMAQRELNRHMDELPQLMGNLARKYSFSETAAHHMAQDILRYRETHGQNPSPDQMDKMIQIAQKLEEKEDNRYSYGYDSGKIEFLRAWERDLLFRHGLSYDVDRDLDSASTHVNKYLKEMQRQIEREREHTKQMNLSL